MVNSVRAILLMSTLALAACYETDADMDVKKDGSVNFSAESVMRKDIYNLYTQAVGEDIVKAKCEQGGGEFNVDLNHVNCKVKVDTTLDELIAGNVQNERNSAPLNLSGMTVTDNGDGTYSMDFGLDWALAEGAVLTSAAAGEVADGASDVKDAADQVEDATDDDDTETASVATQNEDGDVTVVTADNETAGQIKDDAADTEKEASKLQKKVSDYLDGYHVVMTFKAPKILDGNGEMHGDSEMKMDIDLGAVNKGEQALPESLMVSFSLDK